MDITGDGQGQNYNTPYKIIYEYVIRCRFNNN